ncbi:MAG: LysR substrate-binding domain-containing protein [Rhizomicrobium sp.]
MRNSSVDFVSLRYLSVSANAGNFGRAAKALGVQTSTVSRSVARTEDKLGVTLFERGHFGIRLTAAGRAVMIHVRRVLAEVEAVKTSGHRNGSGSVGQIRLGVRMPPVGTPLQPLLDCWHRRHPNVDLVFHEMNERDIRAAIGERRLDVALMSKHTRWPHAVTEPIYRDRILLALRKDHPLATAKKIKWDHLRGETFLVQGWDESQAARELYASFLGSGVRFRTHAASNQTIMALVGAGFGVTLATKSQAEVRFPGVVFKPIAEKDACLEIELVWVPENEEAVVGRFVAFMRDEAHSRRLL